MSVPTRSAAIGRAPSSRLRPADRRAASNRGSWVRGSWVRGSWVLVSWALLVASAGPSAASVPDPAQAPSSPSAGQSTQSDTPTDAELDAIDAVIQSILDAIDQGRLQFAEDNLRALLAKRDAPPLRDLLGVVLSRQERYEEAEVELRAAVRGAPDMKAAREHLGRLYLLTDRHEDALEQLRYAARLGDLEQELALALASAELASGEWLAAEAQLRSVAERFGSVRAALEWARVANSRGDGATALDALGKALEIAPNSEAVLASFARTALRARLPVPALQALEALHRLHPDVAEYPYLLGVARLQVGTFDDAAEALEQALDLDPNRPLPWIALGLVYNQQKLFDEAAEVLGRGLELAPESPEALAALAEAEEGRGNLQAARAAATRAVGNEDQPSSAAATAYRILGTVAQKRGEVEEARVALEKSLALDPASAKSHYQLSLVLARAGDQEGSRRHRRLYQQAKAESEAELIALRRALSLPDAEPVSDAPTNDDPDPTSPD